jgi:YD repeat-containing protein
MRRLVEAHDATNALNQYSLISNLCASAPLCEIDCAYDADGNMTADERGWHYAWNGENRMVCASNAEVVVTYAYDHRGRMVSKEILPTSTNSIASGIGKQPPYIVPPDNFGGPPKEPRKGKEPPYVR